MKKLLCLGVLLVVAGCTAVAPSAPAARKAVPPASRDLICRNGYAVAYNSDGTAYCAPTDSTATSPMLTSPTTTSGTTSTSP